jgi:ATP-dependent RNA helicase RhlE
MKFEEYPIAEGIKKNIARQGFKRPTDIQFKSIPPILRGEDVLAIAQTGTGKTAAFAIPIIHSLHIRSKKKFEKSVRALVMVPTHELAQQLEKVFVQLSKNTRVLCGSIHGGADQAPQITQLREGLDVLIATPGRLFDLLSQGELVLNKLEVLVLDEADQLLDLGFIEDIRQLSRQIPKKRQTLFFSATINDKIKRLAYSLVVNPIRIQVSPKNPVAKNIEHAVAFIEMDDKRLFLANMLLEQEGKKVLVFVRTKVRAERLKKALERAGISSLTLHGDKKQHEREINLQAFRKGEENVLIATDISARGIDIEKVEWVVNYDLPESGEQYVHRVGRTGRAREKGQAISFCSKEERELLERIEEGLDKPVHRMELSKRDYQFTKEVLADTQANDWKSLIENAEKEEQLFKKKKKRKGK